MAMEGVEVEVWVVDEQGREDREHSSIHTPDAHVLELAAAHADVLAAVSRTMPWEAILTSMAMDSRISSYLLALVT